MKNTASRVLMALMTTVSALLLAACGSEAQTEFEGQWDHLSSEQRRVFCRDYERSPMEMLKTFRQIGVEDSGYSPEHLTVMIGKKCKADGS